MVAVVIGVLLLRDDDSAVTQVAVGADDAASVDDGSGDGDGDGDGEDATSTTSTTAAARPPSEVKVLVANGSSVDGAAGAQTDELEALGYVTASPDNAQDRVSATVVYYTVGFRPEAEELADELGLAESSVAELPAVAPVDDMQLANVLVVLGPDLAGGG